MLLQACLNGNRAKQVGKSIPITHEEIAADAVAVVEAGAHALHIHPRNPEGEETLQPTHVADCLQAIRAKLPQIPVGVGTGAWISPQGRARQQHIRAWHVLPDYASVNIGEEDAPETMDILLAKGIGIEAGIWSAKDAKRFITLAQAADCLRILIEMTSDDPQTAFDEYIEVMKILDRNRIEVPILLHGEGGSVWTMIEEAAIRGFSTRIGFEDTLYLPDGQPAANNATLVAAAVRIYAQR